MSDSRRAPALVPNGLRAMRDRIELLGGKIQVVSRRRVRTARTVEPPFCAICLCRIRKRLEDMTGVLLCDDHTLFREGIKAILRDVAFDGNRGRSRRWP